MVRTRLAPVAIAAGLAVASADPAALACSGDPNRPDLVVWRADGRGVTALLSPEGTVVSLGLDGHGWVAWTLSGRFGELSAALSEDATTLITLHGEYNADSHHCGVDGLTVRATDLRTGQVTDVGTLGTLPAYLDYSPDVSPSGTRVAVSAGGLATGDPYQEIFNVETGTRERVIVAEDAHWIDDDFFIARGTDGTSTVVRASDGETLGDLLGGASLGPIDLVDGHPDLRAVTAVEAGTTLVTSTVGPEGITVEREALPRRIIHATRGARDVLAWSDGYRRVVRRVESGEDDPAAMEILDVATGRTLWHVGGQAVYTRVSLSPDGAVLALVSHEPILMDGLGDTEADSPPTLELVDLSTGRVASWGARSRTVATRPEPAE